MLIIVDKIVSIFLIIGLGYFCCKKNILHESGIGFLTSILVKITLPCLLLSSIANQTFTEDTVSTTITLGLITIPYYFVAPSFCILICRYVLKMKDNDKIGIFAYSFATPNTGFMGFPISLALFGDKVLYYFVIENMLLQFYLYGFGMLFLKQGNASDKIDIKEALKSMKNIALIASVIGLVLFFLQIKLPSFLGNMIETIGDATTPLSMILVGMQLHKSKLAEIIKDKSLLYISLARMIGLPMIIFLAVNWLPVSFEIKLSFIFSFSFPIAVVAAPIVYKEGKDGSVAAEFIAVTTLLSIITLPLIAALLSYHYGIIVS